MSGMIGEIPRFHSGTDDFQVYTERLEQFFEINNVAEEKKKALLITSISEDIYKTLRDVCHPVLPKNKTYEELCELLDKQFVVKTSVYRERHDFYNQKQLQNESITDWFSRIKKFSVDCKFGEQLEQILLDRFISGLRQSPILDRLCEEDNILTLQQAVDIAINRESSLKGTKSETSESGAAKDWANDDYVEEAAAVAAPMCQKNTTRTKQSWRGRKRNQNQNQN